VFAINEIKHEFIKQTIIIMLIYDNEIIKKICKMKILNQKKRCLLGEYNKFLLCVVHTTTDRSTSKVW